MPKEDKIEVEGVVIKWHPGSVFDVKLSDAFWGGGLMVRAYVGGKMRTHQIKLIPGDTVTVEMSPYDPSKGRIVFRKK